jgi:NhaP-type Na+/H+ or K+/H+ antiporter
MASDDGIDTQVAALTGIVVTLVLICTFSGNLMQRLNNAYWFSSETTLAIFLGFCASMPFCGWKPFDHVFTEEFDTIFFLYLLPPIIFESGYDLNQKDFFRNIAAILSFAVLGTIISTTVMGAGLFSLAQSGMISGINGTSTKEAMKFGSLMSATDPVATLAVLGSLNVEPQLYSLVFGESVLNDAVAIVLYQTVHKLPDSGSFTLTWAQTGKIVATFTGVGLGSIIIGICFGVFAAILTRKFLREAHSHSEVTIVLSIAYLSFLVQLPRILGPHDRLLLRCHDEPLRKVQHQRRGP